MTEFNYKDRTIFQIINTSISYDKISEGIICFLKPDRCDDEELTSWYQGFGFCKDNLEVIFLDLYEAPKEYRFELSPYGEHLEENIDKLRTWVCGLEKYAQSIT